MPRFCAKQEEKENKTKTYHSSENKTLQFCGVSNKDGLERFDDNDRNSDTVGMGTQGFGNKVCNLHYQSIPLSMQPITTSTRGILLPCRVSFAWGNHPRYLGFGNDGKPQALWRENGRADGLRACISCDSNAVRRALVRNTVVEFQNECYGPDDPRNVGPRTKRKRAFQQNPPLGRFFPLFLSGFPLVLATYLPTYLRNRQA